MLLTVVTDSELDSSYVKMHFGNIDEEVILVLRYRVCP